MWFQRKQTMPAPTAPYFAPLATILGDTSSASGDALRAIAEPLIQARAEEARVTHEEWAARVAAEADHAARRWAAHYRAAHQHLRTAGKAVTEAPPAPAFYFVLVAGFAGAVIFGEYSFCLRTVPFLMGLPETDPLAKTVAAAIVAGLTVLELVFGRLIEEPFNEARRGVQRNRILRWLAYASMALFLLFAGWMNYDALEKMGGARAEAVRLQIASASENVTEVLTPDYAKINRFLDAVTLTLAINGALLILVARTLGTDIVRATRARFTCSYWRAAYSIALRRRESALASRRVARELLAQRAVRGQVEKAKRLGVDQAALDTILRSLPKAGPVEVVRQKLLSRTMAA